MTDYAFTPPALLPADDGEPTLEAIARLSTDAVRRVITTAVDAEDRWIGSLHERRAQLVSDLEQVDAQIREAMVEQHARALWLGANGGPLPEPAPLRPAVLAEEYALAPATAAELADNGED